MRSACNKDVEWYYRENVDAALKLKCTRGVALFISLKADERAIFVGTQMDPYVDTSKFLKFEFEITEHGIPEQLFQATTLRHWAFGASTFVSCRPLRACDLRTLMLKSRTHLEHLNSETMLSKYSRMSDSIAIY